MKFQNVKEFQRFLESGGSSLKSFQPQGRFMWNFSWNGRFFKIYALPEEGIVVIEL